MSNTSVATPTDTPRWLDILRKREPTPLVGVRCVPLIGVMKKGSILDAIGVSNFGIRVVGHIDTHGRLYVHGWGSFSEPKYWRIDLEDDMGFGYLFRRWWRSLPKLYDVHTGFSVIDMRRRHTDGETNASDRASLATIAR